METHKFFSKLLIYLEVTLIFGAAMLLVMCQRKSLVVEHMPPDKKLVYPPSSTATEMIGGTGGYDYGKSLKNSIHTQFGINCMNNCHMASSLDWASKVDAEDFKLTSKDSIENVEVCNKCHPPAVKMGLQSFNSIRFNRAPVKDYDGDGTVEGVQDEVKGLLDLLLEAILASGVKSSDHDPLWENVTTEAQKYAIYNWSFVNHDKSLGVHNTARSVQLLQLSYKDLTNQAVPGAAMYSPVPGPKVQPSAIVIEPIMEIKDVIANGKPIRATALPNVGVGSYVILRGFSLDITKDNPATAVEWSLTPPDGSASTLIKVDNEYIYFLADKQSWYEVKLSITDSKGITTDGAIRIHSATYVGIGSVAGATANAPKCASCHPGGSKSWAETAHAKAFAYAIDGGDNPAASKFKESDLVSYTLAYDPEANNGGFDDVASRVGWSFPGTKKLRPGNWDTIPIELKQVAGVQCESCHGPGGRWVAASISLSAESCGFCHDGPIRDNKNKQWKNSAHADAASPAFTYPFGKDDSACLSCHSAEAFIDTIAGKQGSLRRWAGRTGFQTVTCAVCHDPHTAEHDSQLRVYSKVTMPDGSKLTEVGASAICMSCHNGNVTPDQVEKNQPKYPHCSTSAEMVTGTGGFNYGGPVDDSMHKVMGIGCVDCHMAEMPGKSLPGTGEIGGHTFNMTSENGVENITACNRCHSNIKQFNRDANGDYDGNGNVEGIQNEVTGLLNLLLNEIKKSGAKPIDHDPYWENVTTKKQKAAIYNWSFVNHDKSLGVHNASRSVQLLQRSFKDLTSQDVPGADLR